ncbi:MAG: carbohydrate-binding domain-containing protein, partial [Butyrivibrio sp.]
MKLITKGKWMLSILLSILMLVSLCPVTAKAGEYSEYSGFTPLEGTAGVDDGEYYENYENLVDGDRTTKWCVTDFHGAYIIFSASSAIKVSGYTITTGNDTDDNPWRNPESWVIYGCNDYTGTGTGTWEEIHSVTDDTVLEGESTTDYTFAFDKTTKAYKYFKLVITEVGYSNGENCMQMGEFALLDCDHEYEPLETHPADCVNGSYTIKRCTACLGVIKTVTGEALGHDLDDNGVCKRCDMATVIKKLDTFTKLPASFDYELGSECIYTDPDGYTVYAKLLKVDVKADTMLYVVFAGKDSYVDTYNWIFDSEGHEVYSTDDENFTYYLTDAGTYYIALAGYDEDATGLCHAEIRATVIPETELHGSLDFTSDAVPVPEEGALWSWDEDTLTLTLEDGFCIIAGDTEEEAVILPDGATVVVEGKANIISTGTLSYGYYAGTGIYSSGSITVTGSKTGNSGLTITASNGCGIGAANGNLLIEDCNLEVISKLGITANKLTVNNSVLDITAYYSSGIYSKTNVIIKDSDVSITAHKSRGISAWNDISISGGRLAITSYYNALSTDTNVYLSDVVYYLRRLSNGDIIYMDSANDFSLPGSFCLYDIKGNELYKGEWKDELFNGTTLEVDG